jgi:hypothetical protein
MNSPPVLTNTEQALVKALVSAIVRELKQEAEAEKRPA